MKATDKLRANWSIRERDLMLHYPCGVGTKSDAHWLADVVFPKSVTDELAARGYDVTTLKFSIEPKAGERRFSSQRGNEGNLQNLQIPQSGGSR